MNVKIYTTPTCGYCVTAKNYFNANDIDFTEVNVAEDMQEAEEMVKKSGQMGVPVIEVDGQIIIGFNKPQLDKALGL